MEVSPLVRFNKVGEREWEDIKSEAFGIAENVENLDELWAALPPECSCELYPFVLVEINDPGRHVPILTVVGRVGPPMTQTNVILRFEALRWGASV